MTEYERHFGRLIPTEKQQKQIRELIPIAPKLYSPKRIPDRSLNLSKFRNTRYRDQEIGCCVGESGASMAETAIMTPETFDENTPPNTPINISALRCYWGARKKTGELWGNDIFNGEGALVNHGLLYCQEEGYDDYDNWPSTKENYKNYYRQEKSGKPLELKGPSKKYKPIKKIASLMTVEDCLLYLSMGFTLWIGISWPNGAVETDSQGRFSWSGRSVGGHAVEWCYYDLKNDVCGINNSWKHWGTKPTGTGYGKLKPLLNLLSDSNLKSGESEVSVIDNVEGDWAPKFESSYSYV